MKTTKLGNLIGYAGNWIKNPFTLTSSISQHDSEIRISEGNNIFFRLDELLTVFIGGIKFLCKLTTHTCLTIIKREQEQNIIIPKDSDVYVLSHFDGEYPETIISNYILRKELRNERKLNLCKEVNTFFQATVSKYLGEVDELPSDATYNTICKKDDEFWVFSKVMLPVVIEKILENKIYLTLLGGIKLPEKIIINDAEYELKYIQDVEGYSNMKEYEFTGKTPHLEDCIYASMWQKCCWPKRIIELIISTL